MIIDLSSQRAREARIGRRFGKTGYQLLLAVAALLAATAVVCLFAGVASVSCWLGAVALICLLPALWWHRYLSVLPVTGKTAADRLSIDILARLHPDTPQNPQGVWPLLIDHWQARFIMNHLFLPDDMAAGRLSANEADLSAALQAAEQLADTYNSPTIELGFLVAALLSTCAAMHDFMRQLKARPEDIAAVAEWFARNLSEQRAKHDYGGIGRDWAFGFTPVLDRVGENVSLAIMKHGAHFGWLVGSEGVKNLESALAKSARPSIALIGPDGVGKTTSVYALAQRLIEGNTGRTLAYHQIIGLNATDIMSRVQRQGDLEHLMLTIANEASHAGHVILFFDNAQMFFNSGPGAFDATQILLTLIESRAAPIIMAMTPADYQRLKTQNSTMANQLSPVVLQELPEPAVMRVLEDTAVRLENRQRILVTYEAIREAYRLSGRYEQDEAYPGKAVKLLEQAATYSERSVVNAVSVQQAVEKTRGVKVGSAAPAEAETLLHLEDKIHERMINQTHAVKAVAAALRRARAGVTNPKRPIGSFLFLGPTGVGKTELAKAVAATYFGAESSLIRLDMSEYQQPDDVQRLLATGQNEASSLILAVRQKPFSVVLLDEIEKAHPNILNLLLQLLDEGQLTDSSGRAASFKDCVIIATSNAGAQDIRERIGNGENLDSFAGQFSDELIKSGQFKPELLNRFDDLVLFRPLTQDELGQVVGLLVKEVNVTLSHQNISIELTPAAITKIVEKGNDPRLGARPMRRMLQRTVEDVIAQKILKGEAQPGSHVTLDAGDLGI